MKIRLLNIIISAVDYKLFLIESKQEQEKKTAFEELAEIVEAGWAGGSTYDSWHTSCEPTYKILRDLIPLITLVN